MRRLTTALAGIFAMVASAAPAQYNTSPIEKLCYGGRNQAGLYLCACNQGGISGLSALILGNSAVMRGPGELMDCLEWADRMNGVTRNGGGASARPPKVSVKTPQTRIKTPDTSSLAALPHSAGPCGEMFNACAKGRQGDCISRFNACRTTQVDLARKKAVEAQLLSRESGAKMAARSSGPVSQQNEATGDRHAIKIFSHVETAPSKAFLANPEPRFSMSPDSYLGQALNIAPPWTGTVTLDPGGTVRLAGDAEGTKPIYVDNILVVCLNGSRCVSIGQRDAQDFKQANGGSVQQISRMGFTFSAGEIDLTPFLAAGQATTIAAYAIDYGGDAGVSDIFLIVEGGTSR